MERNKKIIKLIVIELLYLLSILRIFIKLKRLF